MKALVIGGSGFLGSHLVDALLAEGHSVRVYDRMRERYRETPALIDFAQGDFGDAASLAEALVGVDVVLHLLSTTVPGTSNLNPVADIEGNLVNTVRLIEMMRAADVKRLVFVSSGGTVYGIPQADPVPETHPLQPISSYGIVKAAIEKYLHMEHHLHGLSYTVLRASNPYGPRQGHGGVQGVIGTYLWNYQRKEPLQLWGDGSVVRDFIFVDDLIDLCVKAAQSERVGVFNAGSGEGHSIRQIIAEIGEVVGEEIAPDVKPGRGIDVPRIVLDITKAKAAYDWAPTTPLRKGIAASWQWVEDQAR
ncbi:MAG: NAD-dependent epimerase/dehydratase family protein [Pseudomonadota bacterium]